MRFFLGNIDTNPNNMIISITITGYTEHEIFMSVCEAEELFQMGLLVDYLKEKFNE
jgi:hypothetical protein